MPREDGRGGDLVFEPGAAPTADAPVEEQFGMAPPAPTKAHGRIIFRSPDGTNFLVIHPSGRVEESGRSRDSKHGPVIYEAFIRWLAECGLLEADHELLRRLATATSARIDVESSQRQRWLAVALAAEEQHRQLLRARQDLQNLSGQLNAIRSIAEGEIDLDVLRRWAIACAAEHE